MNYFNFVADLLDRAITAMQADGALPGDMEHARVHVEPPRDAAHGDIATNAAMVLAKPARKPPRAIAEDLARRLAAHVEIAEAVVAGPGFINLRLTPEFVRARLVDVLRAGADYGRADIGDGELVNVEYVSANPTGPLHAAHARGAVVGDALAALLEHMGHKVVREYYVNDAGTQVDVLARSAHLRYREALGEDIGDIPSGHYPGDYLKDVGRALAKRDGARWRDAPEAEWLDPIRDFAVDAMMALVRADLKALGVEQDPFTSERALVAAGAVDAAAQALEDKGLLYVGVLEPPKGGTPEDWESRPQTLFRATVFGDDVDRPLRKSDGSWTYFASDIANHYDKFRRGARQQIDVWGADHSGYVKRMQAAVRAVTGGAVELDVKICQIVHLLDGGEPVRMSKRAGNFVTLRDVINAVGKDVVRFIMLTRRNDQTMAFDYRRVTEQSRDNPVFYVQYAHARCCSVLRHAAASFAHVEATPEALADADLTPLADPAELALIRMMAQWPRLLEGAARSHEAHRIAFYLCDLAGEFHALWNKGKDHAELRFLIAGDDRATRARLALVWGVRLIIGAGLTLIGVTPAQELRE